MSLVADDKLMGTEEIKTPIFETRVKVGVKTDEYIMAVIKGRPVYAPVYDERALVFLKEYILERIEADWDFPILMTGERGSGKSMLALRLARTIDPALTLDSVIFDFKDFGDRFQNNSPGGQIILDEAVWGMYAAHWMHKVQAYLVKILDMGRAKRQISYFLVPNREHLNKKVREDIPQLYLHLVTQRGRRGFCEVRQIDRSNPFMGSWWEPYFAFTFTALEDDFWAAYQAKKMAFLSAASDYKKHTADGDYVDQVMVKLHEKGMTTREIGELFDRDQSQIVRRINRIKSLS